MNSEPVKVIYEATPNPHAMKFILDRAIAEETVSFSPQDSTVRSPLARKLFGFPWAAGVLIGRDFVTITKQDWVDWSFLADPVSDLLSEHLTGGECVLLPADAVSAAPTAGRAESQMDLPPDAPVVDRIKQIINQEIRPAVAMDGGDIAFDRFEDGVVYIYMQGACSGCPSASMTLKQGIEARLCEAVPEVHEVVAL